jgi:hypothetical protein
MFVTPPRRCGWERRCRFGVAGLQLSDAKGEAPAGSGRGWVDNFLCVPLDIPDLEAGDVELNGLLFLRPIAERRGDALHHQLLLRDGFVARIAHFPVSGTAPESRHAVVRQTTVLELFADEYG